MGSSGRFVGCVCAVARRRRRVETASMKGVALTQPARGKQAPTPRAVGLETGRCIARARRLEATNRSDQLRERLLIEPNRGQQNARDDADISDWARSYHQFGRATHERGATWPFGTTCATLATAFATLPRARSHSSCTCGWVSVSARLRAMTTRSTPIGTKSGSFRNVSRAVRFTRLRTTALPSLRVVTIPRRDAAFRPSVDGPTKKTKCAEEARSDPF